MKTLLIILFSVFLLSFIQIPEKQYAKCKSYEQADSLQNYINKCLTLFSEGYSAERWCNPIDNKCKAEYYIDLGEGKRNEIIMFFLPKNFEVMELDKSDTCIFPSPKQFPK